MALTVVEHLGRSPGSIEMGKTRLITGAASGTGRSSAELVLECDDRLIPTARNMRRLQGLADRYGDRVRLEELDVANPADA